MADAGCINAYDINGCFLQTIDTLNSENVGQDVCYCFPNVGNREIDYVCYIDKCGCNCRVDLENEFIIHTTQGVLNTIILIQNNANETVNVKWSELFGSNWKKTIVRYKTGGYPVSEVDGILAIEETTQNQYATNGYTVSGLADETTYYFRAFAIAQDDSVIMVQDKNITTDFKYHPKDTALLYLPINSDDTNSIVYDHSIKGNNASWYSSANYATSGMGKRVLKFTGSQGIYCNNKVLSSQPYTLAMWFKLESGNSNDGTLLSNQRDSGNYGTVISMYGTNELYSFYGNGSAWQTTGDRFYAGLNMWYCYVVVVNGSSIKKYVGTIGGSMVLLQNITGSGTAKFGNSTNMSFGYLQSNGSTTNFRFFKGYMGDILVDQNAWDITETNNFFNKTKKLYGEVDFDNYQEVEYIESSGTQYIDTGYKTNRNVSTKLKIAQNMSYVSENAIFGDAWSASALFLMTYQGYFRYHFSFSSGQNVVTATGNITEIETNNTGIKINGTNYSYTAGSTFSNYNIHIFNTGDNSQTSKWGVFKLYYFKLYDNGILVRDFIPCYRKSDGVIGMFDKANNVFYTNAGTGTFTKGPNVG